MIFWKYQGTGNDFILIDNWSGEIQLQSQQIQSMCDRKFGIGADGVILIEKDVEADFNMNFFNPDGSQSFCGNGSRCAVRFAIEQGLVLSNNISFRAIDGMHEGRVEDRIEIKMRDVHAIVQQSENQFFLNTGSPHVVKLCSDLNFDVVAEGSEIRYDQLFAPGGTNVNFMVPENLERHPSEHTSAVLKMKPYLVVQVLLPALWYVLVFKVLRKILLCIHKEGTWLSLSKEQAMVLPIFG